MPDAYIENMETWCKSPELSGGIYRCS